MGLHYLNILLRVCYYSELNPICVWFLKLERVWTSERVKNLSKITDIYAQC